MKHIWNNDPIRHQLIRIINFLLAGVHPLHDAIRRPYHMSVQPKRSYDTLKNVHEM